MALEKPKSWKYVCPCQVNRPFITHKIFVNGMSWYYIYGILKYKDFHSVKIFLSSYILISTIKILQENVLRPASMWILIWGVVCTPKIIKHQTYLQLYLYWVSEYHTAQGLATLSSPPSMLSWWLALMSPMNVWRGQHIGQQIIR